MLVIIQLTSCSQRTIGFTISNYHQGGIGNQTITKALILYKDFQFEKVTYHSSSTKVVVNQSGKYSISDDTIKLYKLDQVEKHFINRSNKIISISGIGRIIDLENEANRESVIGLPMFKMKNKEVRKILRLKSNQWKTQEISTR